MTKQLLICTNFRANPNNPSCAARGSKAILDKLKIDLANKSIEIECVESTCMGYCNVGPNARLVPNGDYFHGVSADNLAEIISAAKKFSKN